MATYLPQTQDAMEKVNPPQTDWQFEGGLLGTRQGKYDQGMNQARQLYGSILNAGLTRDSNIQSRDDFFKAVDQDLRKIAGMDLSKDSNISRAKKVFSQIYDNKPLAKDMVWTKNFRKEMERAEGFRACVDPAKCGGEYWEDGVKAMNYQREEFKNMSQDESLSAGNVKYVPYNNMMEKAIKHADAAGLSVTRDDLSGRYIVRTKNGANLISPLTTMFNELYAENPDLNDMYKVKAYNERKDWTYNQVRAGKYETIDEAAAGYVEMRADQIIEASQVISRGVDLDVSTINGRLTALQKDYEAGKFDNTDVRKMNEIAGLQQDLQAAQTAQGYTDLVKNAQKNMHNQTNSNAIGAILDEARAQIFFNEDLTMAATTLAHKDMEVTMTADKFALADQAYAHDVNMYHLEQKGRLELERTKAELKSSELDPNAGIYMMKFQQKQNEVTGFTLANYLESSLPANIQKGLGSKLQGMSDLQIRQWVTKNLATDNNASKVQEYIRNGENKLASLKYDANIAAMNAHKYGNNPSNIDFYWDQFTPETWESFQQSVPQPAQDEMDIPLGAQALEVGPLLYQYPGNNNIYYKKEGDWYRGSEDKNINQYVKIKSRGAIDNLNANGLVLEN